MRAPGKELPALIHPDLETNECALRVVAAGQVKKLNGNATLACNESRYVLHA